MGCLLLKPYPNQPNLPLLVYCPGMDGTGYLLHRQAKSLSYFFNIRCLSYLYEDNETWETLTQKSLNILQKEIKSLSPPSVYLLGESFGGCLALNMVLQAPKCFNKVILVNSASAFRLRPWLNVGGLITQYLPDPLHQSSCLALLPFLASLERLESKDRRSLLNAMRSLSPNAVSRRIALLNEFKLNPTILKTLKIPFLILAGSGDHLLPSLEEADYLTQLLPNSTSIVLPESGHACLLEKDLYLVKILKENHFLPMLTSPYESPLKIPS